MGFARADPIEPDQNLNRNNDKILKRYSSRTNGGSSGIYRGDIPNPDPSTGHPTEP